MSTKDILLMCITNFSIITNTTGKKSNLKFVATCPGLPSTVQLKNICRRMQDRMYGKKEAFDLHVFGEVAFCRNVTTL